MEIQDGQRANDGWYRGIHDEYSTVYHVPTELGFVVATVYPDATILEAVHQGVIKSRRIEGKGYKKTGVTRSVRTWLRELKGGK